MIHHDSTHYRIEECHNTPLRFALDRKEPQADWSVCLNNIGWYRCMAHALMAMVDDDERTQHERLTHGQVHR